jgi:hypothetical protein
MDHLSVRHTLPYIGTPLRALMLGPIPFAWMRCSARAALVSAATNIPQGILSLVWSVKTLSAFDNIGHAVPSREVGDPGDRITGASHVPGEPLELR